MPPPKDMPCKRDCPDRYPGCLCNRKRQWDAEQIAKKEQIRKAKEEYDSIDETLYQGKKRRR